MAAARNPLRPQHQDLHGHDRYRSHRHLVALTSPDPSQVVVQAFYA